MTKQEGTVPSLRLLVVEDDASSLELLTEVLGSMEAEVSPISDSREAAVAVNRERFDGIFLDLEMPNLDGFALAQIVRGSSWNKSTPIVVVTGRDERETMSQSFATGANFFLQKPIDRNKLARLFRTVRGALVDNRRRHTRVPLQTEVTCQVGSKSNTGRTWNLSVGGIQVEAGNLNPGDTVRVSFRLPRSSALIDSVGRVVWANEDRQGIQFINMSNQNQEYIQNFIQEVEKP
jgi:CheY-like chemotaxis protein